ncbi:MAG: TagF domain-containing protein [Desulfobacula sp.]|uniref:TagF domain-containing protein n=1 Tax=Desulfobacula sp. TaxID=2593537 RepID=UPI0025C1D5F1|nr:TagF domain-containing protein [Desulfobacula sp.]MCD4721629.1 TagF domain-containing protein [Desulfobacula sp.]
MLGIRGKKTRFELSAYGKHPAFSDYFSLNTDSPLVTALSVWVEEGTKRKGNHNKKIHSFRFWVRGIKKGELALGIIRDSSDHLGRPYPLLITGVGFVKNWEKKWNYIFSSFGTVFRAFEDISASRYDSFRELETSLARISFPESLWINDSVLEGETSDREMNERFRLPEMMMAWFNKDREKGELSLPVATLSGLFASTARKRKEGGLFGRKTQLPGAVFLGGLPENPVLTIYTRPLKTDDFRNLFTAFHGSGNTMDDTANKGDKSDGS